MEQGFILMNLSKYKRWRALLRKTIKKRTDSSCVSTQWKSTKLWKGLIHRIITKQQVKNEQIKRKQACPLCFVNAFKFQENNFKIVQMNF